MKKMHQNKSTYNWVDIAADCKYQFPDASQFGSEPADEQASGFDEESDRSNDLIVLGADLAPSTLLTAYSKSLFPMYVDIPEAVELSMELAIGWFSPQRRAIFELDDLRITRSMKKSANKYKCKINTCFKEVMSMCQTVPRHGGWITNDFIDAYAQLHELGFAHSVEVFEGEDLVGGLYGVGFGNFFAGESMVHIKRDASKVALMYLVNFLKTQLQRSGEGSSEESGNFLLDAQWMTSHLHSLGAKELRRSEYLARLNKSIPQNSIYWP